MYLALYRKYRPKTFGDVVGQQLIIKTLKNQIKNEKISHAYLFTGSRGTGKTSVAKIFSKAINCLNPAEDFSPCGECKVCKALQGANIDVLEIDAASNNGVDEIRDLREMVKYPAVVGKYKVYIIDEVHMLSISAFNALLKTLEEPPANTVFILATTEAHKIPATILSRCLRFDFELVALDDLEQHLRKILSQENVEYDNESVNAIARAGEGSVRDMLSIADRCISFAGSPMVYNRVVEILGISQRERVMELANIIFSHDIGGMFIAVENVLKTGKTPLVFSNELIEYFRDLLMIYTLGDDARKALTVKTEDFERMKEQATKENLVEIETLMEILGASEQNLRYSSQPKVVLENALINVMTQTALVKRIEKIEEILKIPNNELSEKNAKKEENSQKIAEKPQNIEKVVSKTPQQAQEIEDAKLVDFTRDTPAASSGDGTILGDLLSWLRENKQMSTLMTCRQIESVKVENNTAEFCAEQANLSELIANERHKALLDEFFKSKGLGWKVAGNNNADSSMDDLKEMLGDKLTVK